jgi:hypothetical protein
MHRDGVNAMPEAICEFVTFESARFDKTPTPETINPCCQCKDAAAWLRDAVQALPEFAFGGLVQEDFGWIFEATADANVAFLVVVQTFDETESPTDDEYGVAVRRVARAGFLKRLFGGGGDPSAQRGQHLALCRAIDAALRSEPSIRNIRWWRDGFAAGNAADHP